jgi:membrane protein YqaA with SNARE-associated domain
MLRRLYDWTMRLAAHPKAVWALGAVSFTESSFFPIPPDVILAPMVIANPEKARLYALWCTVASVLGGIAGYFIGYLLYDSLGLWLISLYGYEDRLEEFRALYAQWGALIILVKGLTPIPYKLVTIASGFAGYDLLSFILLSLLTRGARFFLTAELLRRYGAPMREFVEKRMEMVAIVVLVALVAGFVAVPYLV